MADAQAAMDAERDRTPPNVRQMEPAADQTVDLESPHPEDSPRGEEGSSIKLIVSGGGVSADSGKVKLWNWAAWAPAAELVLLVLVVFILSNARYGDQWIVGSSVRGESVSAGLHTIVINGVETALQKSCHAGNLGHAGCMLAEAGRTTAGVALAASTVAVILLIWRLIEEVHRRLGLGAVRTKLREGWSAARGSVNPGLLACIEGAAGSQAAASLLAEGGGLLWALLVGLEFAALVTYAAKSPHSLGAGPADLATSYGLLRLALLLSAIGGTAYLTMVRKIGEPVVVKILDYAAARWHLLGKTGRIIHAAFSVGIVCELASWVWAPSGDWAVLLLVYGMAAHLGGAADKCAPHSSPRVPSSSLPARTVLTHQTRVSRAGAPSSARSPSSLRRLTPHASPHTRRCRCRGSYSP